MMMILRHPEEEGVQEVQLVEVVEVAGKNSVASWRHWS